MANENRPARTAGHDIAVVTRIPIFPIFGLPLYPFVFAAFMRRQAIPPDCKML